MNTEEFIEQLASKEPIPGGGGAAALIGTLSAALLKMVANLTTGKKKYAAYQNEIDDIITRMDGEIQRIYEYIQKDADAFEPLSKAYGLPKEQKGRAEILENALVKAAEAPLELMNILKDIVEIIEALKDKGTRLAISDIGVSASACKSAVESAAMNVYINTGLMKNLETANSMNRQADNILDYVQERCTNVYEQIKNELRA